MTNCESGDIGDHGLFLVSSPAPLPKSRPAAWSSLSTTMKMVNRGAPLKLESKA